MTRKLLIYRDSEQAELSARYFDRLGFESIVFPLIRFEGRKFELSDLHRDCEHILIPSLTAAKFFFNNADMYDFCQGREIHCIGDKFPKVYGADFAPIQSHLDFSEALGRISDMNCRELLYPCKQGLANIRQEEALNEGISLRPVMCYEQFEDLKNQKFQDLLLSETDIIILSLSESQASLLASYDHGNHRIACLGTRTANRLKALGVPQSKIIVADRPNFESLTKALKALQ